MQQDESSPVDTRIRNALTPDPAVARRLIEQAVRSLKRELPECQVSFEAGDIVTQIMSFGSPTPIEVAVQGISLQDDYKYAQKLHTQMAKLAFLRDLQFAQAGDFPTLDINIDRDRAGQNAACEGDLAQNERGHGCLRLPA